MSNYVFGTRLSYQDYLQAQSVEDSIRSEISSASRSIIATKNELARGELAMRTSMALDVKNGFEQLSYDVRDLSTGIADLNSTFQWGFSEALILFGGINDSLKELLRVTRTPEQTWAFEQFEIARDAFRRQLYDDGIQYLNRAIDGHGSHTGYNLEYRFHYLLGTIRIGSFFNASRNIVDPQRAEKAFLSAAKYSMYDLPKEAARSYLCAGWAAYCQGNMSDAERLTRSSIDLDGVLAEGYFQLAKIQMHADHAVVALPALRQAICLDRGYAVKACSDRDFARYQGQVDVLLEELRAEALEKLRSRCSEVESKIFRLEELRKEEFPFADETEIAKVEGILTTATVCLQGSSGTFYGYLNALQTCSSAESAAIIAVSKLRQLDQNHRRTLSANACRSAEIACSLSILGLFCFPFGMIGILLGISARIDFERCGIQDNKGTATMAIRLGSILSLLNFTWVALEVFQAMRK
jgi:tetratricopeptide (TPR) repeat protein